MESTDTRHLPHAAPAASTVARAAHTIHVVYDTTTFDVLALCTDPRAATRIATRANAICTTKASRLGEDTTRFAPYVAIAPVAANREWFVSTKHPIHTLTLQHHLRHADSAASSVRTLARLASRARVLQHGPKRPDATTQDDA